MLKTLAKYLRFYGGKYECNVCNRPVRTFFPLSDIPLQRKTAYRLPFYFRRIEAPNYNNFNCPFCLANDRERLFLLYLQDHFKVHHQPISIIDFGPSQQFANNLGSRPLINYTSADMAANDVDLKIDICNMHVLESNSFDVVICSRVLEPVSDPLLALKEIRRILRKSGFAIISSPLATSPPIDEEGNCERFDDRDTFLNQLKEARLEVEEVTPDTFDSRQITKHAIAKNSIFYICRDGI